MTREQMIDEAVRRVSRHWGRKPSTPDQRAAHQREVVAEFHRIAQEQASAQAGGLQLA